MHFVARLSVYPIASDLFATGSTTRFMQKGGARRTPPYNLHDGGSVRPTAFDKDFMMYYCMKGLIKNFQIHTERYGS